MGTFKETELPAGQAALAARFVNAVKVKPDNTFKKRKARLVARGDHEDTAELPMWTTFASTPSQTFVRVCLAAAAASVLKAYYFDYTSAYLHAELPYDIYMQLPKRVLATPGKVWRLLRALYSLAASGAAWHRHLASHLESLGFTHTVNDQDVWIRRRGQDLVLLCLYCGDGIASSATAFETFLSELSARVTIGDSSTLDSLLGVHYAAAHNGYDCNQRALLLHALHALDRFGMRDCNPVHLPINVDTALPAKPLEEPPLPQAEHRRYQSLVQSLAWVAQNSRPDLTFPVHLLNRHNSNPSRAHVAAAPNALRYLRGTLDWRLRLHTTSVAPPPLPC